jgi:hypothetical protein
MRVIFAIQFFLAISRVNVELKYNVSETSYVSIIRVDVRTDQNFLKFVSASPAERGEGVWYQKRWETLVYWINIKLKITFLYNSHWSDLIKDLSDE